MTTEDDLARVLHGHARLAPDAEQVLARIQAGVARRRRHQQLGAAGGAGLAVLGLVIGAQALAPGTERQDVGPAAPSVTVPAEPLPAPAEPAPPVGPSPDSAHAQRSRDAFLAAGYDTDDATELAQLWRASDPWFVKAVAGQQLVDDVALPFAPGARVDAPAPSRADDGVAQAAFFAAGYDLEDATALSLLWDQDDLTLVKTAAGRQLLARTPWDDAQQAPLTAP